jgi:hypothetical protein
MEQLVNAIFSQYGALGFGWLLAAFLLWKKFGDDAIVRAALDKNTQALIEFKVLLTERLPR